MKGSRFAIALLLLPLLGAAGGKGCRCGPKPPPDTDAGVIDVADPAETLKVVSVEPSVGKPGVAQDVVVYGSGFQEGVAVRIGDADAGARFASANTANASVPGLAEGAYDVIVTNPNGATSTLRRGYVVKVGGDACRFLRVQFEFDRAELTAASVASLEAKKSCLLAAAEIVVEGHADERGTTEYNLALGERRAEAVLRWLVMAGVLESRVRLSSYGEEKPLSRGHDEAAWAENRRAEIHAYE